MELITADESVIKTVLDCTFAVHKEMGPGLLEGIYEKALAYELTSRGMEVERQVEIPAKYRGQELGMWYKADMIVEG